MMTQPLSWTASGTARQKADLPGDGSGIASAVLSPGWRATTTYTIPGGFTLPAGATVTLHRGSGTNIQTDGYWGRTQHVWNNAGDTAYLRNTSGRQVATKTC